MKFGSTENIEGEDFKLPLDHPATAGIISGSDASAPANIYVGCAKWNKKDLKNFYPRGTGDELPYYAAHFNSIELNATFYNMPKQEQIVTWRDKTPAGFKFFPKVTQSISHMKRLNNVETLTDEFCNNICRFEDKLGMVFLQLHDNFGYKNFDRLIAFVENFPASIPLAIELRNTGWFNDVAIAHELCQLFEQRNVTNIIVDTAGRRDLLHMRLTTPVAFVRYVGANNLASDRARLDDWVMRLANWLDKGLKEIYFFVHQNIEMESPHLAAYFIEELNKAVGLNLRKPTLLSNSVLF